MKLPLWTPSPQRIQDAQMTRFQGKLETDHRVSFASYADLHRFSIEHPEEFWGAIWDAAEIRASTPFEKVFTPGSDMTEAWWFEGARLNFAENLLRDPDDTLAIWWRNEVGHESKITRREILQRTVSLALWMQAQGVQKGDRIAGYLPNLIETVIAMLATAALGAIWSSTSPDFGHRGVLDRFGQIEPVILFTTDGYFYKGKALPSLDKIPPLLEAIPSIRKVVVIPCISAPSPPDLSPLSKAVLWADASASVEAETPFAFAQLPFDHPLFILYSSGTTGVPKCIVHGAGGTLLQHFKEHHLHTDLKPGDPFFYFTTCGWMMWNWLVTGLLSKATLLLFEGSPFHPDPGVLWRFAEDSRCRIFGASAKYLAALEKSGLKPREAFDLTALETILSTGSPLSEASFHYVYRDIKADVHLASISGGTDLISCFVLGNPCLPVYSEEIQCRGLGMAVEAFDDQGQPIRGDKGEMVCTRPFPSQPIGFWNDPGKRKYKEAYFDFYPDIWRHGDLIEITPRDGITIYGRSDATLNPGGVRIGTAEIYRAVEPLKEIADSLVVGRDVDHDVEVILFVKMQQGFAFDEALQKKIRDTIRQETTPRHVPAKILAIADIPYTISGKKVELAVRRILHGQAVPNRDALANPEALDLYRDLPALKTAASS